MLLSLPTLDQMTDILDIKPLYRFSLLWFWVILSVLALLLAGFLIFLYLKNRRKERQPVEIVIPEKIVTPKEKALGLLEDLEKLGLLERGQYRKHYFILSEILKTFLEEELKIAAVDATTEEIIPRLSTSRLSGEHQAFVASLLREMDLVKFARKIPASQQVNSMRQEVRQFLSEF